MNAVQAKHSALPGAGDTLRAELDNGIIVLIRENHTSPSAVIFGYIGAGSRYDAQGKEGLASFCASALMRGTQKQGFMEIFESLESVGASLGFGAGPSTTSFGGRCLAEDLPLVLGLLAECLRQPTFPQEQMERLRSQILTSLSIRDQDTSERAEMAFDELLFPNHPFGIPSEGFPATVSALSREDLVAFQRGYYSPGGMRVVIVGAVDARQTLEKVQNALGDWQPAAGEAPERTWTPPQPLHETVRLHIPLEEKPQTDLVMGCLGPRRGDEDYQPVSLGNHIFGQFGMAGRIGESVREKAGLAYAVSSALSGWLESGCWQMNAAVNPADLERTLQLLQAELELLLAEGVSAEELADSQANYIGRLPLSLESNSGVAGALLKIERYNLGMDYFQNYAERVNSVTPDQVHAAMLRWLDPTRLAIVSAGTEVRG